MTSVRSSGVDDRERITSIPGPTSENGVINFASNDYLFTGLGRDIFPSFIIKIPSPEVK